MSIPDVALAMYKFILGSPVGSVLSDPNEAYVDINHIAKLSGN